jgi:hypothetical protein
MSEDFFMNPPFDGSALTTIRLPNGFVKHCTVLQANSSPPEAVHPLKTACILAPLLIPLKIGVRMLGCKIVQPNILTP